MNVSNLNGDVCVGVSPVEDGSEVELRVSFGLADLRPHCVILAAHQGVNIRSCASQITSHKKTKGNDDATFDSTSLTEAV